MTREEKLALLRQWEASYLELDLQMDRLSAVVGGMVHSPFGEAVWGTWDNYTRALAELVGDDYGWLNWYCFDNDMGKKAYEAGWEGDIRPIAQATDLLWLIEGGAGDKEATWGRTVAERERLTACQGAKCGCIDGYSHSPECVVEAAACQGWLNTPEAVDALLKVMVDRFLGWKLPKDFAPDCRVHFDREAADAFVESWPSGTNLLHAGQAMEMFKHCLPAELIISERAMGSRP